MQIYNLNFVNVYTFEILTISKKSSFDTFVVKRYLLLICKPLSREIEKNAVFITVFHLTRIRSFRLLMQHLSTKFTKNDVLCCITGDLHSLPPHYVLNKID